MLLKSMLAGVAAVAAIAPVLANEAGAFGPDEEVAVFDHYCRVYYTPIQCDGARLYILAERGPGYFRVIGQLEDGDSFYEALNHVVNRGQAYQPSSLSPSDAAVPAPAP